MTPVSKSYPQLIVLPNSTEFKERMDTYDLTNQKILLYAINIYENMINILDDGYIPDALYKSNKYFADLRTTLINDISIMDNSIGRDVLTINDLSANLYGGFDIIKNKTYNGVINDFNALTPKYSNNLKQVYDFIGDENSYLTANKIDIVTQKQIDNYNDERGTGEYYYNIFLGIYLLLFIVVCFVLYSGKTMSLYSKTFTLLIIVSYPFWIYYLEGGIYSIVFSLSGYIYNMIKEIFTLFSLRS